MHTDLHRNYADTPWGPMHYRESGQGAPLLLLHSSSGSSRVFRRLMPLLPDYRCIAPDLPGFGESAPLPAQVSMEQVSGNVVAFLDALGIAKAHVFGLHSGNKLAAALAAGWPERVHRLVVAGMTHSLVVDTAQRNAAMLAYAGRAKNTGSTDTLIDKLTALWHRPYAADSGRVIAESLDLLQASDGADAMYPANLAFDFPGTLARVTAPTLVLELTTAAESGMGLQGPLLIQRMASGKTATLPGDDRDLLQNRPAELVGVLMDFLRV
jgi:pimeloyl-ACP methyl ester carboxylesterase